MKHSLALVLTFVSSSLGSATLPADESALPPVEYRFDEVRSSVTLRHAGEKRDAKKGESAEQGDEVETGWFARTVLSVPIRGSRFEILSSTKVSLGGPEPGVLVRLERGRLRAIFDKLMGRDDRLVSAPGALLAVRGTRYGLEVDRSGNATLVVFEGTVEVRPRENGLAPLLVGSGELCRIGRDSRCERSRMPAGMTEGNWPHHEGGGSMDSGEREHRGMPSGRSGHDGSMGGHGGH